MAKQNNLKAKIAITSLIVALGGTIAGFGIQYGMLSSTVDANSTHIKALDYTVRQAEIDIPQIKQDISYIQRDIAKVERNIDKILTKLEINPTSGGLPDE